MNSPHGPRIFVWGLKKEEDEVTCWVPSVTCGLLQTKLDKWKSHVLLPRQCIISESRCLNMLYKILWKVSVTDGTLRFCPIWFATGHVSVWCSVWMRVVYHSCFLETTWDLNKILIKMRPLGIAGAILLFAKAQGILDSGKNWNNLTLMWAYLPLFGTLTWPWPLWPSSCILLETWSFF